MGPVERDSDVDDFDHRDDAPPDLRALLTAPPERALRTELTRDERDGVDEGIISGMGSTLG